jgi:ATP-dependent DNA ligase
MLDAFPEIAGALRELPDAVLDGELVVPDVRGRSDFEELRRRNLLQRPRMIAEAAALRPAVFVVFDVLELDGNDVRSRPLFERRVLLHQHVERRPGVQIIEHVEQHGVALFRAIAADDHEGVVAKRADAPYRPGRQASWVKVKNKNYSRRAAIEWRGLG